MTSGSHLATEPPLGCNRRPCFLSPTSHKPGETNTVTPSWQVPLGAIQFPRETGTPKVHVPSCPITGDQTMPTCWQLLLSHRCGLWPPSLCNVLQGKGYSTLNYWSGRERERGRWEKGGGSALQSGRPLLSARFITGFRGHPSMSYL